MTGEHDGDAGDNLAVIIGGGITYLGQWRLDSIRGKREREQDEAAAKGERERDEAAAARERERDEAAAAREREREEAATAAEVRVAMKLLLDELDTLALHHALLANEQRFPEQLGAERRALIFPTDV